MIVGLVLIGFPYLVPDVVTMAGVAAALLCGGRAAAYEKQWHVGADLGYAALFGGTTSHGFGGGLHLAYGVTDWLDSCI